MATYLNNPQFRHKVDDSLQGLVKQGIRALNNTGQNEGETHERVDDIADN